MEPYEKKLLNTKKMTVGKNIYTVYVIKEFFFTLTRTQGRSKINKPVVLKLHDQLKAKYFFMPK